MALSVEALKVERARLEREIRRLQNTVGSINQLLNHYQNSGSDGSPQEARPQLDSGIPELPVEDLGLRDAIRLVLRESAKDMRPVDVASTLEANSFQAKGKTPMKTRVGNEMWRMARRGILISQNGRYALVRG